jgi:hypothetical protein
MNKFKVLIFIFSIMSNYCVYGDQSYADDNVSMVSLRPMDFYIVSQIQKETNITSYDVEKWKFLFLGNDAYNVISLGLGLKAGIEGYNAASSYGGLIDQGMSWIPGSYQPSVSAQSFLKNNIVWATVAAGGAMIGLYPLLYGRIYDGLKSKVHAFDRYCNESVRNLALNSYASYEEVIKNKPIAWITQEPSVEIYLALHNLTNQAINAHKIILQLRSAATSPADLAALDMLQVDFQNYEHNFRHNKSIVRNSARFREVVANRRQSISEEQTTLSKEADLTIKQNKAWGSYVDNATKVFNFIKGTTAYMVKYKAELAALATGIYLQKKVSGK